MLLLIPVCAWASDKVSTKHFSIEIPKGMIVDEKKEDSLSLVFSGHDNFEKGTLSVYAKTGKDQWNKIKPTLTAEKSMMFEKTEKTPLLTWKTIGVRGKVGQIESESVVYYGVLDNVTYMLHYHCQKGNCTDIETAFHDVLASFKPEIKTEPNTPQEPIR
jgi:hypothetical protein